MNLLAATGVRGGWLWYGYCATLVAGAVVPAVPVFAGYMPNGIVAGAGLLLIAAALLVLTTHGASQSHQGPSHQVPSIGTVAAATAALPGVLLLGISLLPPMVVLLVFPITLVEVAWQGPIAGVGLIPPRIDYPIHEVIGYPYAVALLLLGCASAIATYARQRRPTSPIEGLGLGGPAAVLMALASADAPWPVVPLAALVIGLLLMVAAGLATLGPWRRTVLSTQGGLFVISGLFGALPTRTTTVLGLGLVALAASVVGALGRLEARVPGWILAVVFAGLTAAVGGLALGRAPHDVALAVLATALVALLVAAALRSRRRRESSAVEATAHVIVVVALALTANWVHSAQLVCAVWALAVGLRSRWPGTSPSDRRFLLVYSGVWWLLAWWLVLGGLAVAVTEAYTLPLAGLVVAAAWACRRRWPRIRTRMAYAPAAALVVLPTLSVVAADAGDLVRWLALGVLGAVVVALVSLRRFREGRAPS